MSVKLLDNLWARVSPEARDSLMNADIDRVRRAVAADQAGARGAATARPGSIVKRR